MQLIISGNGVNLTDAIESYVSRKMSGLEKFASGIIRAAVVVGRETKHRVKGEVFYAEGKVELPGPDIFVKKTAASAYEAIDRLKAQLERELKKVKIKKQSRKKRAQLTARAKKEYQG